jgi:hypothetical protein
LIKLIVGLRVAEQVAATYTTFQNSGGFFGPLIGSMATVRY